MIETYHQPVDTQLILPSFKLDKTSEICRDPYAYLKHLATSLQKDTSSDTIWLKGLHNKICIKVDSDFEIPQTTEPPFICISVWPDMPKGGLISEIFVVGPQGTIYTFQSQEERGQPSIVFPFTVPAPKEIAWISDAHQHAASATLFIDQIVSTNESS